jgi:hypothetical protein
LSSKKSISQICFPARRGFSLPIAKPSIRRNPKATIRVDQARISALQHQ